MTVGRLYVEEMKGLPRGRFALAGAAFALVFIAFLAVVMNAESNGNGLRVLGILAFMLAPSFIAPFAAARMVGARTSRFAQSLFTAPVTQGAWFWANVLVSLSVGALYLVATMPFVAVAAYHVGAHEFVSDFLPLGALVVLAATAFGTLVGVMFTNRGVAAPASIATVFMFVSLMAVPFLSSTLADQAPSETLVRLMHLMPHVAISDAVGIAHGGTVGASTDPGAGMAAVAVFVLGSLGIAWWTYTREQGVESWETTGARRSMLALAVVAVILAPGALAGTTYEEQTNEGHLPIPRAEDATVTAVSFEPTGKSAREVNFADPVWGSFENPIDVGEENTRDLLILLPEKPGQEIRDITLKVTLYGRFIEDVSDTSTTTYARLGTEPAHRPPGGTATRPGVNPDMSEWPLTAALRVPIALTPQDPWRLGMNLYTLAIELTYTVDHQLNETAVHTQTNVIAADTLLRADVPGAEVHLGLAGVPIPLVLAAGAVRRRLRTQ